MIKLNHFKPNEFNQAQLGGENWWPHMSIELLYRLDALRGVWGEPIEINKVIGAIGRRDDSGSDHNFNNWGEVRGIDVNTNLYRGVTSVSKFIDLSNRVGFNAIGFYPDSNTKFFHLGVRDQDHVSEWGRIGGKYSSLEDAIEHYRSQA